MIRLGTLVLTTNVRREMSESNESNVDHEADDKAFAEIVAAAEAGVADVMAVYENAEARYFAAVSQSTPLQPNAAYSTHT